MESSAVIPYVDVSMDTQSTWVGAQYKASMCMLLDADGCRFPSSTFFKKRALLLVFYDSYVVQQSGRR